MFTQSPCLYVCLPSRTVCRSANSPAFKSSMSVCPATESLTVMSVHPVALFSFAQLLSAIPTYPTALSLYLLSCSLCLTPYPLYAYSQPVSMFAQLLYPALHHSELKAERKKTTFCHFVSDPCVGIGVTFHIGHYLAGNVKGCKRLSRSCLHFARHLKARASKLPRIQKSVHRKLYATRSAPLAGLS